MNARGGRGEHRSAATGLCRADGTPLAPHAFADKPYIDFEDPDRGEFATLNGRGFLAQFPDGALRDEVQRVPEVFAWLQGRLDAESRRRLFVWTRSLQFGLRPCISQTPAGRVGHVYLLRLSALESRASRLLPATLQRMSRSRPAPSQRR